QTPVCWTPDRQPLRAVDPGRKCGLVGRGLLNLPTPPLDSGARDAEAFRGGIDGQPRDALEPFDRDRGAWPAQSLALRPGPRESRPDPLHDAPLFEFGDGPENLHLETTGRRRGVDALPTTRTRRRAPGARRAG